MNNPVVKLGTRRRTKQKKNTTQKTKQKMSRTNPQQPRSELTV